MKNLFYFTVFFSLITTQAFAEPSSYLVAECFSAGQNEDLNDSVTDFILAQNTFDSGNQQSLFTAIRLNPDASSRYTALGAALIAVDKSDTEILGMFVCNKSVKQGDKSTFSQSHFSFDNNISVKEILKAGKKTIDLQQGVYMGDEHVATKGSKLVAEVVQTKEGIYTIKLTLTLKVADLTLIEEEISDEDLMPAHEILTAEAYLSLPNMSLQTK